MNRRSFFKALAVPVAAAIPLGLGYGYARGGVVSREMVSRLGDRQFGHCLVKINIEDIRETVREEILRAAPFISESARAALIDSFSRPSF